MLSSSELDPSHIRPGLTMAECLPLGLKSSRPYVSRRSANSMAARGSSGLLFAWVSCSRCRCWPPRRPTDASAPPAPASPTSGARPAAASSMMQASRWQNASRPSRTGPRLLQREGLRPRDCRLRRGHQAQPEGRLVLCAPVRGLREQGGPRRGHCRLHRGDQDRSEIWLGLQQPWRRQLRSA
jgi:hypothetical protein